MDISGSKVVRVNDLHLLREEPNLWVVHVDVGFKGLDTQARLVALVRAHGQMAVLLRT